MKIPAEYEQPVARLHAEQAVIVLGKNHTYYDDHKYRVGVTTAIDVLDKPGLRKWGFRAQIEATARAAYENPPLQYEPMDAYVARLKKMGEQEFAADRLRDEAAVLGNEVHALIEHHIKTGLELECEEPFVSDAALDSFAGWLEWAKDADMVPLMAEGRVANRVDDYAGTFDLLCLIEGRLAILDWKPKPDIWPSRRLQSAGYRQALKSMGWPDMDGMIVAVARDGSRAVTPVWLETGKELERTYQMFLFCARLHAWQKDMDKLTKPPAVDLDRRARVIQAAESFQKRQGVTA